MFLKPTIVFTSLVVLAVGLWVSRTCVLQNSDIVAYEKLSAQKETPQSHASSVYQTRQGVSKDLWYVQEDKLRLHHRIESESSVLTMLSKKSKIDVVENLENISCWMQDKLYIADNAPMQQLRFFQAKEGTYHYANQQFFAQTVHLSLHRLPTFKLPEQVDPSKAFLQGIAQDVSFFINDNAPKFQAEHFKATLKSADQKRSAP